MEESCLEEELETLSAIYLEELTVIKHASRNVTTEVEVVLHPATAQNLEQQYVCLTLNLEIPEEYPALVPKILIKNPRGLNDDEIFIIEEGIIRKADECKGHAMLYQLIELAKEYLTAGNSPSCECPICLYNFSEADVFIKTDCYHYFHSYCLASYVETQETLDSTLVNATNILCPICRTEINPRVGRNKDNYPPPVESLSDVPDDGKFSDLDEQRKKLAIVYEKQKAKGGIIDLEVEKNKYLLTITGQESSAAGGNVRDVGSVITAQAKLSEDESESRTERNRNKEMFSKNSVDSNRRNFWKCKSNYHSNVSTRQKCDNSFRASPGFLGNRRNVKCGGQFHRRNIGANGPDKIDGTGAIERTNQRADPKNYRYENRRYNNRSDKTARSNFRTEKRSTDDGQPLNLQNGTNIEPELKTRQKSRRNDTGAKKLTDRNCRSTPNDVDDTNDKLRNMRLFDNESSGPSRFRVSAVKSSTDVEPTPAAR